MSLNISINYGRESGDEINMVNIRYNSIEHKKLDNSYKTSFDLNGSISEMNNQYQEYLNCSKSKAIDGVNYIQKRSVNTINSSPNPPERYEYSNIEDSSMLNIPTHYENEVSQINSSRVVSFDLSNSIRTMNNQYEIFLNDAWEHRLQRSG